MLEFYIRATSKFTSGLVLTCESAHSWCLYSAAPLENQASNTMTEYSTQSHYPNTEPASSTPILLMLNTCLVCSKSKFLRDWFDSSIVRSQEFESPNLRNQETDAQLILVTCLSGLAGGSGFLLKKYVAMTICPTSNSR